MKVGLVVIDENPADALRIVSAADRAGVHSVDDRLLQPEQPHPRRGVRGSL
jgi:hypothetical protein